MRTNDIKAILRYEIDEATSNAGVGFMEFPVVAAVADRAYVVVESESRRARMDLARDVEPILSLLHYRGIVDSPYNRQDVANALRIVRKAIADGS